MASKEDDKPSGDEVVTKGDALGTDDLTVVEPATGEDGEEVDRSVVQDVNPLLVNDPREIEVEQAIEEAGGNRTRVDTDTFYAAEEKSEPLGEEDNKTDIAEGREAEGDEEE